MSVIREGCFQSARCDDPVVHYEIDSVGHELSLKKEEKNRAIEWTR